MQSVFRHLAIPAVLCLAACGPSEQRPPASTAGAGATAGAGSGQAAASTPAVAKAGTDSANTCPVNGLWAPCSVLYRLVRAGVAPKIDSTARPAETALGGTPVMFKIGRSAELEVHLYPDSTARAAAAARLDRTQFVNGVQEQTIRRERTLIESANLLGFLTSINSRQRERVWDALAAGPPQP